MQPNDEGFYDKLFDQLRTLIEWTPIMKVFEPLERDIPLHHATRVYMRQSKSQEIPNSQTARWRYFTYKLSSLPGIEWESGSHKKRSYGDRIRLRHFGECPNCHNDQLRMLRWGRRKIEVYTCLSCGTTVEEDQHGERRMQTPLKNPQWIPAEKAGEMAEEAKARPPSMLGQISRLVGMRVMQQPSANAGRRLRLGLLIDVVPSNNVGVGDIALVEYGDGKVELVPLSEMATNRELWQLSTREFHDVKPNGQSDVSATHRFASR